MTLREFLDNPELLKKYKQWINEDIGIIVRSILKDECTRPVTPSSVQGINEDSSSFALGHISGNWNALDKLENLDSAKPVDQQPEESYGAKPEDEEKAE